MLPTEQHLQPWHALISSLFMVASMFCCDRHPGQLFLGPQLYTLTCDCVLLPTPGTQHLRGAGWLETRTLGLTQPASSAPSF